MKLITDAAQAALETPTPENLAIVKAFWTAVLDVVETEADVMRWEHHRSWHELARKQVAATVWDDETCTVYSWKLLKTSTDRMVQRFPYAARQVVKQAEETSDE